MAALEIPCPECGRLLKIPDRKMLGRKARCGKCGCRFILQEPGEAEVAEVEQPGGLDLEFASADDDEDRTLMGVAARYVPQEGVGSPSTPADLPAPGLRRAPIPVASTSAAPMELPVPAMESVEDATTIALVRQRKRAVQRRQRITIGASVAAVVVVTVGLYAALVGGPGPKGKVKSRPVAVKTEPADEEAIADVGEESEAESKVTPISLALVPEGARIIIHLRPADLWQTGGSAEEFRACLGPLGVWLESVIKTKCLLDPAKIEEVLFALIPISRDEFDMSFVVRTKNEMKKSELLEKFDGELMDRPRQHYVGPERAWLILDTRTFAGAPRSMVESFVQSANGNSVTSDGIEALLAKTDRKRHFTLVCELEDVRLGSKNIAPESAQKLLEGILDFFGDDVETIAWSLNLGDMESSSNLVSELLVRNKLSRSPPKLEADLKKKLAGLPGEILNIARKTDPKKIGEKKIVGRYPAMTKVVQELTHFNNSHRLVTMNVELPERAGPNLAIGTLLAWNQTTLPDYGKTSAAPERPVAGEAKLPDKIADRLKKKITVDFRNDFLFAAIDFIGDETGVKFKLDGPNMKLAGVTQNERQQFAMEAVPATAVLYQILIEKTKDARYPNGKLVLVVDEAAKTATVTSLDSANDKKLTAFPLQPAGK